MGQPKFPRKKFETPNHPWQGERIKAEHELRRKFGLKNKSEIWKAQSRLRSIRGQARSLISATRNPDDGQAAAEAKLLLRRLHREGYVGEEATLNDVLGMDIERVLNRRLQSQVYLKGMARTPKQARQFVSHGLILVGERRVDVPSYVVRRDEEEQIMFVPTAAVADEDHPVRPKAPGAEVQEIVKEQKDEKAGKAAPAETVEEPKEEAKEASTETVEEPKAAEEPTPEPAEEPKVDEAKEAPAETVEEPKAEATPEPTQEPAPEPAEETKAAEAPAKEAPEPAAAEATEEEE